MTSPALHVLLEGHGRGPRHGLQRRVQHDDVRLDGVAGQAAQQLEHVVPAAAQSVDGGAQDAHLGEVESYSQLGGVFS